MTWPQDVLDWHEAMGLDCSGNPELGMRLIDEEACELDEAVKSGDRAQILKETLDLIWVLLGNLFRHGITVRQIARGWRELVRSNGSKVGAPKDASGKLQKGSRFVPWDASQVFGDSADG